MKNVLIIQGTARSGRQSIKVTQALAKIVKNKFSQKMAVKIADPAEIKLELDGRLQPEQDQTYHQLLAWADAVIIVLPEYNHGYPGSLKRLLDSEYELYAEKPVGLVGVSAGFAGGARVVDAILPVLSALQLRILPYKVLVRFVQKKFAEDGSLIDEKLLKRLEKLLKQFVDK